jgi:hypothetical protein
MLKTIATTILLIVLFPIYCGAYIISKALKLKDFDLMETPTDFLLMAIDKYYDDTAESRYIKKLTKQVEQFYKEAVFIPAPSIINLYDADCALRIADDMALLGEDKNLIKQILDLTNLD